MTTIHLDGIVGWDITLADIRRQLAEADGPVDLLIHSPGGSVYDGFAIHNAIRDHRRTGATVTATVTGLAASMATYIAMAAESVAVEDNAVFMVHNPAVLALGDHRTMRKTADILDSLAGVLGRAYEGKTGRDVRAEMDAETFFFGAEIVEAGYADRLIPAGDGAEDRPDALALAQHAVLAMTAKLREADSAPLDQIAALLPHSFSQPRPEATMPDQTTAGDPVETVETVPDPAAPEPEQDPDHEDDLAAQIQAALAAERARVSAITARCAQVGMPAMAAALIEANATLAQTDARIVDAWVAAGGPEIRAFAPLTKPTADASAAQRKLFAQVAGRIQE